MDIGELHPPDVRDIYSDLLGTAMDNDEGFSVELEIQTRTGKRIPTILSASKVNVNGILISQGIYHDISARKEADAQAIHMMEIQQGIKMKDAFLANMSHELRTPLNVIIGYSEVLIDELYGNLNDKQRNHVEKVLESSRHLLALINDMLDMSKIEAGMFKIEKKDVDLGYLLRDVMTFYKEELRKKAQTLSVDLQDDMDYAHTDATRVKQVLMNLVSNAIKFTPQGGKIDISMRQRVEAFVISVTDNGTGMTELEAAHAFEPFWQGKNVPGALAGTGLGLSISKRLVELLGGRIWIESEKGKGTTVGFTLPRAAQNDAGACQGDHPVISG
jgi:signal transduction histidine kinase